MENSDLPRLAMAWAAAREGEMLSLLERLVRINSHSENREGVEAVAEVLRAEALAMGLAVRTLPLARFGPTLVAESPACAKGGKRVLLCGHMDTVFPQTSSFQDFRREGEQARGPGVFDMKGGLVVGLFAVKALADQGLLDEIPVSFVFNSDEEVGSPESGPIVRQEADKAAFGLVFEGGGPGGDVATGRKGAAPYRLEVFGRAGHAGMVGPDKASANLALARKVVALEALNNHVRGVTVNVGRMVGGTGRNIIPDNAHALIDSRWVRAEDGEKLARDIQAIADTVDVTGTRAELARVGGRPPMEQNDANRRIYAVAHGLAQALGVPIAEEYRGGVSDANLIADQGVPVLDGLGPVGGCDHSDREFIRIASLVERTALSALTIRQCWRLHQDLKLFG